MDEDAAAAAAAATSASAAQVTDAAAAANADGMAAALVVTENNPAAPDAENAPAFDAAATGVTVEALDEGQDEGVIDESTEAIEGGRGRG